MPSISSPIAYPPSSSPVPKRKLPLKPTDSRKSRTVGGFLVESDDEDGPDNFEPVSKKRMLEAVTQEETPSALLVEPVAVSTQQLSKPKTSFGFLIDDEAENDQEITPPNSQELPAFIPSRAAFLDCLLPSRTEAKTCSGKSISLKQKVRSAPVTFVQMAAQRSVTKAGRAKKSYFGVDIQQLMDEAAKDANQKASEAASPVDTPLPSVESTEMNVRPRKTMMWTEKYRARRYLDLVGDDRINRQVLGWLKGWDQIVFGRKPQQKKNSADEQSHRKILLLTGPPGLGKTTLAHVCARQAGYEVMEINASDERSRDVVKGRIRTSVGTESVKSVGNVSKDGKIQKAARPVCVVVDEVDGVVTGSGASGDGGFVKALLDLMVLDQRNSSPGGSTMMPNSKKKDDFRLRRPIILICNDVYHPSLRPLRQSNFAEVIHVRAPPVDAVVSRMKSIFEREGISCDTDGVRRLCECAWGTNSLLDAKSQGSSSVEGDLRGVLVVGEWAATKIRASAAPPERLTRKWIERNLADDMSYGGQGARGIGRGGAKEVVSRVFLHGAGFSASSRSMEASMSNSTDELKTTVHANELAKRAGMERLRAIVDASGEIDKIVTEIWSEYPTQPFNDDNTLSKPDAAYEWLYFHDRCSKKVFTQQSWEMAPYLSQPVLACHNLFAGSARRARPTTKKRWQDGDGEEESAETHPFNGPRAEFAAHELEKTNQATLLELQAAFSPALRRSFRNTGQLVTDLVPYLVRILTPDIKPVIVRGGGDQAGVASVRREAEKQLVRRAVDVMSGVGVLFQRGRIDDSLGESGSGSKFQPHAQWVYRMEPPIDSLTNFDTGGAALNQAAPVRYAVRQVLDQEHVKAQKERENAARQARLRGSGDGEGDDATTKGDDKENKIGGLKLVETIKKDFFGRVIKEDPAKKTDKGVLQETDANAGRGSEGRGRQASMSKDGVKVWVTYHEGYSNAVRKPVTVLEIMRGL